MTSVCLAGLGVPMDLVVAVTVTVLAGVLCGGCCSPSAPLSHSLSSWQILLLSSCPSFGNDYDCDTTGQNRDDTQRYRQRAVIHRVDHHAWAFHTTHTNLHQYWLLLLLLFHHYSHYQSSIEEDEESSW